MTGGRKDDEQAKDYQCTWKNHIDRGSAYDSRPAGFPDLPGWGCAGVFDYNFAIWRSGAYVYFCETVRPKDEQQGRLFYCGHRMDRDQSDRGGPSLSGRRVWQLF